MTWGATGLKGARLRRRATASRSVSDMHTDGRKFAKHNVWATHRLDERRRLHRIGERMCSRGQDGTVH